MTNHDDMNDQALSERAGRLPREIRPDRDLWPGIEHRLGDQLAADEDEPGSGGTVLRWQAPALAAGLLMALVLGYWVGQEDAFAPDKGGSEGASLSIAATPAPDTGLQPVSLVEEVGLLDARRAMAAEVEAGLERLPEDARQVVLENMAVINKALDEIDTVLAQAPASGLDRQLLISMYADQLARLSSLQMLVMNSNQETLL